MRNVAKGALLAMTLTACDYVQVYQAQIDKATHALETASTDGARAVALAERGRAYSNKARLSLVRSQIDRDEYLRLFDLAIADHDRAVALLPADAEPYFQRGLTYYDRAFQVDDHVETDRTKWSDAARADFSSATEKNPRHATAHDFLGLVNEQTGRIDDAVANFTRVLALDSRLGRLRLAELHCNQGQARLQKEELDLAAIEFEKSAELAGASDGCSCEPFNALAYIYIDATGQYEKGWDLVRRARGSGHRIAREYVERLEKASPAARTPSPS